MIINHIVQRREERRQRKARWMLSRCFTEQVHITDIIIEKPIVIEEPVVIQVPSTGSMSLDMEEEPVMIVVEPLVIEKATVSTKHIDEAAEELRKRLILNQTIKKLSSKKSNLTLCIQ